MCIPKQEFFVQAYLALGPYNFSEEVNTASAAESAYMRQFDELARTVYGDNFLEVGQQNCLFWEYYQYWLKEIAPIRAE